MKRIFLFLITNIAVMVVLSVVTRLLGLDQVLAAERPEPRRAARVFRRRRLHAARSFRC